jgi:hypothetical protein
VSDDVDPRIRELSQAIQAAAKAHQWLIVRSLNQTLRQALASQRSRHMTKAHKKANSQSNASTRAYQALEDKSPSAPLLAAFAADQRFGSLRAWCTSRAENRSSMSWYLHGRGPMPARVYDKIRRDFPDLEWEPPAGVSGAPVKR